MAKSKWARMLRIVPVAVLSVGMAIGVAVCLKAAERNRGGDAAASRQSQQAAEAIVALAKNSVLAAKTDDEAVNKAQMSLAALDVVGQLGDTDTSSYVDKLMDDLASAGRPAITDALVQLRFFSKFRQWSELTDAQKKAAFDRLVTDVKRTGLTPQQARMVVQVTNSIGDSDGKLISAAVAELPQLAQRAKDPEVRRMAAEFEGIMRRLDLPGNQLELSGSTLEGNQLDWNSYRGKVVLVDFFASWCGPCRAEVPNVLNNYRAYHDKGFEVVGVNLDTDPSLAEQYRSQTGFKFPTIFSSKQGAMGWDNPIARRYGIAAIPRVMLVDKDGKVVSTSARGERLGELLGQLLGPSGSSADRRINRHALNDTKPTGDVTEEADGVVPASVTIEDGAPGAPDAEPAPAIVPDDK